MITSDQLREGAANQRAAGGEQLEAFRASVQQLALLLPRAEDDDGENAMKIADRVAMTLITSLVAHTNAIVMESEAGVREELLLNAQRAGLNDRRRLALERNDAIRQAAANGDWNLFDELTNSGRDPTDDRGSLRRSDDESSGAQGGTAATGSSPSS